MTTVALELAEMAHVYHELNGGTYADAVRAVAATNPTAARAYLDGPDPEDDAPQRRRDAAGLLLDAKVRARLKERSLGIAHYAEVFAEVRAANPRLVTQYLAR